MGVGVVVGYAVVIPGRGVWVEEKLLLWLSHSIIHNLFQFKMPCRV